MENNTATRLTVTDPATTREARIHIKDNGTAFLVFFGFTEPNGELRMAHGKDSKHYTTRKGALKSAHNWTLEAK